MLYFYNTLTRTKEEFHPINIDHVGIYTCGPTVYNYPHIGNLRTYLFEDIIKRVLKYDGYKIFHVMNITDVGHLTDDADEGEDKIEVGALREGKSAWDIASFYTAAFHKDMELLDILEPNVWCKATDHIPEQIKLVETLIDKGYTYETSDGIYFNTTKLSDYGKLALLEKQEQRAGARVNMGEKKNPQDFALWKFTAPETVRQMEWDAFGKKGFPGWHLECSAMSMKYLGDHFDIHCGGIDHIPVHHTNEIAQSEAATGKHPWVRYWMHGEFMLVDGEKMSKSKNNFFTLEDVIKKGFSPMAYRYFLLQAHYRKQINFTWEALEAAENGLARMRNMVKQIDPTIQAHHTLEVDFYNAINDDLNIPEALAVTWKALKNKEINLQTLIKFDKVFGLKLHEIEEIRHEIPPTVETLLNDRAIARTDKNWSESDRLRDEIAKLGFDVLDTNEGQKVEKRKE